MTVKKLMELLKNMNGDSEIIIKDIIKENGTYSIEFINKNEVLYHNGYSKFENLEIILMNHNLK